MLDSMTKSDIARYRLYNQRISHTTFTAPEQVVAWLGAMQAQDYLAGLWAVGLRMKQATEQDIEQALADRKIIRTWPMRGTLHFVTAEDARWMLALMTPRVIKGSAGRFRQLSLDDQILERAKLAFIDALRGDRHLTRAEMHQLMEDAGVITAEYRGSHILGRLAQEGLICFGPRQGKQQTFVLLDEWLPKTKPLERDQALAEIVKRYFNSHGPATIRDFVWWSGLTVADTKIGLAMNNAHLLSVVIEGVSYWMARNMDNIPSSLSHDTAYLLPSFDEYLVAYRDRTAVLDPAHKNKVSSPNLLLSPTIVMDGAVIGTWKRRLNRNNVIVTPSPFNSFTQAQSHAYTRAIEQYTKFLIST